MFYKNKYIFSTGLADMLLFPMLKNAVDGSLSVEGVSERLDNLVPSVSKILEYTRPPESQLLLDKWKQRMIKKLGEEEFLKQNQSIFVPPLKNNCCKLETNEIFWIHVF